MNPISFGWDGDAMVPASRRFAIQADKQYVVGENYTLVPVEIRSMESHRHFFASVRNAWENLREDIADEFPTAEHLRAWGLVKSGFADKTIIKCASNDDAIELAALAKGTGKIRIVEVSGKIVTIWTPHSQSMKAMGKQRFQESKQKVLDVLAAMVRVEPETLASQAA
jgi:hypothetical protein